MRKIRSRYDEDAQRGVDRLTKEELRHFYAALKAFPQSISTCRLLDAMIAKGVNVLVSSRLHLCILIALFALLNPRRLRCDRLYSETIKNRDGINYIVGKIEEALDEKPIIVSNHELEGFECVNMEQVKSMFT